jgi:predicted lipoprotein with Yx(FWY)xxD motif
MIRLIPLVHAAPRLLLLAPAAGITMLVAACGGVGYGTTGTTGTTGGSAGTGAAANAGGYGTSSSTSSSAAGTSTSVAVGSSRLGQILTDSGGRTLYLFEKDSGSASACDASCASVWPPVTTAGAVQAGSGASTNLVATIARGDGTRQVTYNGHPLYYYVGDQKPGDTGGQDLVQFGGGWYVLSPSGTQVGQ